MKQKVDQLQKKIMRRIYYAYALRFLTQPLLVHAGILFFSVYVLSRLTHVAAIMNNLRSVRVGELDTYILNTLMHTEFLTLLFTGLVMFTLLSLPLRLSFPRHKRMQTA